MSETKTKQINHPLEDVFDIETGSTLMEFEESIPQELASYDDYDVKDQEIEQQFEIIYTKALDAYEEQIENTAAVEGKYKARNADVAVQFLNTALSAVREKSVLKQNKDKVAVAKERNSQPTVNNNLIVDRNTILKMIMSKETNEIKQINNDDL